MKRFFLVFFALFFLSISSVSAITIKQQSNTGLVAWLPFNEGTSTLAHDIGPYQNNTTLLNFSVPATSASGWTAGKKGAGLYFDGVDDRVTFSGCKVGALLSGASAISSTRWIWVDSVPGGGSGYVSDFVTMGQGGAGHVIIVNDSLTISAQSRSVSSDSLQSFNSNTAIRIGTWNHVALVVDYPSDTVKIYLNGVLDKTASATFGNNSFTPDSCTSTDLLGASPTPDRFFDGKIDDYRVYNRALTDAEVTAMYRTGQITRQTASTNGLVGWWTFDEGTSTTAHDFSGQGNIGSLSGTGGPTWIAGERGKALFFAGNDTNNNQTVTITAGATNPELAILGDVTVSAWVKPSSSYVDGNQAIVRGGQGTDLDYSIFFNPAVQGPYFHWYDGSTFPTVAGTSNSVPFDRWSHVTITRSGTTVSFYVNGVFTNSATVTLPPVSAAQIAIGRTANVGVPQDYSGAIDDVRIYNRALSSTEISDLYRQNQTEVGGSQEASVSSGLVGYWSFNGKDISWQENRAFDRSGNSFNGTIVNLGTTTAPTIGKVGQALTFNGSTSYIRVPYAAALAPTTAISYGAWFKTTNKTLSQKIISKTETGGYAIVLNENVGGCSATSLCGFVGVDVAGVNTYYGAFYDRSNIQDNKWHHVMTTYDGETVLLYLDGVQVASNTAPTGPVKYSSNNTLCIGVEPDSTCGVTQYFSGGIDEVRVYNRTITAAEVKRIYLLGK